MAFDDAVIVDSPHRDLSSMTPLKHQQLKHDLDEERTVPSASSEIRRKPSNDAQERSLLQRIRAEFQRCAGGRNFNCRDLALHWLGVAEEEHRSLGRGQLSSGEKQAIALGVAQLFREIDLAECGTVGMQEWVHYMLIAHSGFAGRQINSLLSLALKDNKRVLHELQEMFDMADFSEQGSLTLKEIVAMYGRRLWHFRPGVNSKPLSVEELQVEGNPELFAKEILQLMDVNGDEKVTYPEFMAYCLGRRKAEVKLHVYDLSKGLAEAASPWVVGEPLEGIWHTGIVVFGKEYYYAKDTVFDEPGLTSFGKPTKVLHLGYTLWRQDELHEFVVHQLKPIFHRGTYDVITNNCNHFTDRVSMYLLAEHVPEEVLQQPKFLLRSNFVRVLRPMMNWWLRDRVAMREKGKDLPPGRPRLQPGERPPAGAIVVLHPEEGGNAGPGGGSLLARVKREEGDAPKPTGWFSLWDSCTVHGAASTEVTLLSSCSVDSKPPGSDVNGIWVQYFDCRLTDTSGACQAQVRTELVDPLRLSMADMDDEQMLSIYAVALKAVGLQEAAQMTGHSGTLAPGSSRSLAPQLAPAKSVLDSEWSSAKNGTNVSKEDVVPSILTKDMIKKSSAKPFSEEVRRL